MALPQSQYLYLVSSAFHFLITVESVTSEVLFQQINLELSAFQN